VGPASLNEIWIFAQIPTSSRKVLGPCDGALLPSVGWGSPVVAGPDLEGILSRSGVGVGRKSMTKLVVLVLYA